MFSKAFAAKSVLAAASLLLLTTLPVAAAEPSGPVPVIEAPKQSARMRFVPGPPKPPCADADKDDLGTLWSSPNGASLWLPPHAEDQCGLPEVMTQMPKMMVTAPRPQEL